jgi:hypothetical protein
MPATRSSIHIARYVFARLGRLRKFCDEMHDSAIDGQIASRSHSQYMSISAQVDRQSRSRGSALRKQECVDDVWKIGPLLTM